MDQFYDLAVKYRNNSMRREEVVLIVYGLNSINQNLRTNYQLSKIY